MANEWPEVSKGQPGPLYGVFGQEAFLLDQALKQFISSPAFASNPSLNQEYFLAAETQPSKVLDSANTLPFLGSRRLVIVQDIDAWKAEALNSFLDYFNNPAPTTCMVFSAAKLDARSRFAKALQSKGKVLNVRKPYPRELPAWLQGQAKTRGKSLSMPAVRMLMEMGDMGLLELDREIEKLCLYVGKSKEISPQVIKNVTSQGRLFSVFDLTNAIAAGELGRALSALSHLLAMNEAPLAILAMITRLFKQLSQVRKILDQGGSESQVQQNLRTPPQVTADLVRRARTLEQNKLKVQLENILHADLALKSSAAADKVVMETLLFKLCQKEAN